MADAITTAFANYQSPGLKDGTYTITAQIVIDKAVADAPTFQSVQKVLQVGTGDVSLPAGSIVSVYPPENESGDYSAHLPHVVLNNPTLAWQRDISKSASDATPWMALLLLTDAEMKQLGVTGAPGAKVLSLPLAAFQALAPSETELAYLAHVRKVRTTNKADAVSEEDYAVVIGNRLPPQKTTSMAFLVSLAELGDKLPPNNPSAGSIDLAVLYAWRFFAIEEARSFADVVSAVDRDPATLRLPPLPTTSGSADNPLAMGYVPLPHALRVGGRTVSWYRGPFVPYAAKRQLPSAIDPETQQPLPISWADAVAFYDPTTGMFDASCASAWTLGRLLALNAGSFAAALYNWKRSTQRATIEKIVYELDTGSAPSTGSPGHLRRARAEQALAQLLPAALAPLGGWAGQAPLHPAAAALHAHAMAPPRRSARERAELVQAAMTDHVRIRALHGLSPANGNARANHVAAQAVPAERLVVLDAGVDTQASDPRIAQIWAWLGDLTLLKNVPLFYLVPDERMLPAESIRFFRVDQSWMQALIDGALSIGRVTAADQSHDAAFHPMMQHGAAKAAACARQKLRGMLADGEGYPQPPARPVSGFFLRSSAVATWPRMEVSASGPNGAATILRMEVTGTLMICLFDAAVDTIYLHPPSEGIHFGFDPTDAGKNLVKNRRRLAPDGDNKAGSEILDGNKNAIDPLVLKPEHYRDAARGILDVAKLAGWFIDHLQVARASFTSAEFAVEMVAGVEQVAFRFAS